MIVDGRTIADDVIREVKNMVTHQDGVPHLTVFTCAPNFETQKFLALKKRRATEAGIAVNVVEFPEQATTEEIVGSVCTAPMQTDGVIIQLPFPAHIAIDEVLACVPPHLDVDVLSYHGALDDVLPPVVGAIREIARRHHVPFQGARVVVVGNGRLVGRPAAAWAAAMGARVDVVTVETSNEAANTLLAAADILILGAGIPHHITPDRVRRGAVIFDAGTSESSGVLAGDADPSCADVASLMTPVPGGIGPVTVAVLLRNLVLLAGRT